MEKTLLEEIKKRLEVIISLQLHKMAQNGEGLSLRSQIRLLYNFGLKPREISEILGRSNTYINKELSYIRKARK